MRSSSVLMPNFSHPSVFLRYLNLSYRRRKVAARTHAIPELIQMTLCFLIQYAPGHSIHSATTSVRSNFLVSRPYHYFGYWLRFCLVIVNHPVASCRLFLQLNMSAPSIHHLSMTSSLLRTDLPPIIRHNLLAAASLSQVDSTLSISLVPFDRLTTSPAILTPDETCAVIRLHACSYRRCKRNHLLLLIVLPFRGSSIGSLSFSSQWSYLSRCHLPF